MAVGNASTSAATNAEERELVITRIFDAPRALVFKAWMEPERMKRWFGPKTFTTPHRKIDLRPGGGILLCMRSPEGQDYWVEGVYHEIVEPERIVYAGYFSDAEGNVVQQPGWPQEILITVTFAEHKCKTKLTLQHAVTFASASERDAFEVGRDACQQGWTESLDRLAGDLAKA